MKKQINIRIDDVELDRVDAIRSQRVPVPNVSELIRALINEAYEKEVPRGVRELRVAKR